MLQLPSRGWIWLALCRRLQELPGRTAATSVPRSCQLTVPNVDGIRRDQLRYQSNVNRWRRFERRDAFLGDFQARFINPAGDVFTPRGTHRSEEHTAELQS